MSTTSHADAAGLTGATRTVLPWWIDVPAVGAWLLGFATAVVLGISGGGYDAVLRGEAGIAAWWIVAAGLATGALALPRSRVAWAGLALFGAFVTWTALGLTWTLSDERTVQEIARTAGYAGVLLLGVAVCARAPVRHLVAGLATGLVVVCGYAALTRLHAGWFDESALVDVFPTTRRRLAAPLGYWNALGGLAAMTLALLLAYTGDARRLPVRAAAAAMIPVVLLVLFWTVSRGGVIAAGLAVLVWFALAPDRLAKLGVLLAAGAGSLVVCVAAERRDALQAGLDTAAARSEADGLLVVLALAMAGTAALVVASGLAARHATRPRLLVVPRRRAGLATLVGAVLVLGVFLGAGGGSWAGDRVDEFKGSAGAQTGATDYDNSFSRLRSVDSNGRYDYWVAARDAQRQHPLEGTGPGTFEYVWARSDRNQSSGFVRDAHSLWFQTLAELDLVGLLLVAGVFALAIGAGAARALRAVDPDHRSALAGATAGVVAFCAIASVEWAWQMTVLGAAALLLVAACLAGGPDAPLRVARRGVVPPDPYRPGVPVWLRVAGPVVAVAAVVVIAIPTASTADVRDSQAAVRADRLAQAYRDARAAEQTQPSSASALLQQALVLERAGDLVRARGRAVAATDAEPSNWRTWLIRSRLEARTGSADAALASYRRVRALNPRSPLLAP